MSDVAAIKTVHGKNALVSTGAWWSLLPARLVEAEAMRYGSEYVFVAVTGQDYVENRWTPYDEWKARL